MKTIKLIDYLHKPHLIQHIDGRRVKYLNHFPDAEPHNRMMVDFEDGGISTYYEDGRYIHNNQPRFCLIPDLKEDEDQTQPLKPHDFEEGIRYQFREHEGWAKFVTHIPEAQEHTRLVFITDTGDVITRYTTGRWCNNTGSNNPTDVMPKEYEDPAYEYHINVYPNHISEGHPSRDKADRMAKPNRIDCVCIRRGKS